MPVQQSNPFVMSNDWAANYMPKRNQDYRHAPKLRWVKPQVLGSPGSEAIGDISRKLRLRETQKKRQKSLRTEAHLAGRKLQGTSEAKGARLGESQKKRKSVQNTEARMAVGKFQATLEATGVHHKLDTKKANASRYMVRKKHKNTSRATPSKTPCAVPATNPTENNNNVTVTIERRPSAFELCSPAGKKSLAIDRAYVGYSMKMTETSMYLMENLSLWRIKLKAHADLIPAWVAGEMESTVGKSKLFLDSKIPQFAKLLNLYLVREDAMKPVLVSDLQGWWDAFSVEFGKLKFSFSVLQQLQENNWQPMDSGNLESESRINTINAKRTKNNGIRDSLTKPRKSSPAVLQFLAGKREEMRLSAKLGEVHPEVIFLTSASTTKDPSNPQPGPSKEGSDTVVSTPPRPLNQMPVEIEIFSTPGGSLNESLLGRTIIDSPGDTVHYSRLKKKLQPKRRLSRKASMAMLALGNALDQTSQVQKIPPNNSDSNGVENSSVVVPEPETKFASALSSTLSRAQDNLKLLTSAVSRSRWNPWK